MKLLMSCFSDAQPVSPLAPYVIRIILTGTSARETIIVCIHDNSEDFQINWVEFYACFVSCDMH